MIHIYSDEILFSQKIISDDTTDLKFTGKAINVKGSEGLYVDSKDYMLQTNGDVSLTVEDSKSVSCY